MVKENVSKRSERMKANNPMKNPETAKKVADKLSGREGRKLTDAERLMHSTRMKANNPMKNPETAKKVSLSHKGKTLSEEQKQKISLASKGKTLSEETKKKMSVAHSGKGNPAYGRKWMNNGFYKYYAKPEEVEEFLTMGFVFGLKINLPNYVVC